MKSMALTQTVQKGGCAAKVAASELKKILAQVRFPANHPELLVDGSLFDDAAIYKVSETLALVQTLDFFTPILDTPRLFGQVAATNALSDVYAMGGRPKTAMAILAFPLATMPGEVITEVMQGACDKIGEAKANLVGGHSIDDDTLKFGLSVTGFVSPQRVWSNAGAKPGDALILTKPLGTGTLCAGLKRRELSEDDIQEAIASMSRLNNVIDFLDERLCMGIHAATDITGFGFSGHSMQLAQASEVTLSIELAKIPRFERALECLEKGLLTKAHRSNAIYTESAIKYIEAEAASSATPLSMQQLLHDPQTSGGLLLSVDSRYAAEIVTALEKAFPGVSQIGKVEEFNETSVLFLE